MAVSKFARKAVAQTYAPMKHQAASLKHDATSSIIYDASDPGTGKTAVRVWAFAARRRKKGGCALVLCKRTLMNNAWANDFKKFAPDMKVAVATAAKREAAFSEDADVYITNHDAAKWIAKQKKAFFDRFDELIIDEIPAYKHKDSQRSRAVAKIAKFFKYRSGLSATPNSNGICDVWHQAYILDDGKRLGTSFYAFRSAVCEPRQVGRDRNMVEWVDKEGSEEAVFGLLSDIVIRHKIDECVDIPPTYFHEIEFELDKKQRAAYEQLEFAQIMHLNNAKITAINAAAVATKLLQTCSGAVYGEGGQYHLVSEERYDLIMDLVAERKHPLVFFYWSHQKEQLAKKAAAAGMRYAVLDGDATDTMREDMVRQYQAGQLDVLFAHPQTAAHGLTLTTGTSTIWCGPTYDLEWWAQGNKRQRRIGQTQKTEVIMVLAKDTIEEKVYTLLQKKDKSMTTLLSLFDVMAKEYTETPRAKSATRRAVA